MLRKYLGPSAGVPLVTDVIMTSHSYANISRTERGDFYYTREGGKYIYTQASLLIIFLLFYRGHCTLRKIPTPIVGASSTVKFFIEACQLNDIYDFQQQQVNI